MRLTFKYLTFILALFAGLSVATSTSAGETKAPEAAQAYFVNLSDGDTHLANRAR